MFTTLALLVIGALPPPCPWGSVCDQGKTSASVTITVRVNVESAQQMAMYTEDDEHGIQIVRVDYLNTGSPDGVRRSDRVMVMGEGMLICAMEGVLQYTPVGNSVVAVLDRMSAPGSMLALANVLHGEGELQ